MISLSQQIEEVERELRLRSEAYPRWVATRKMRQAEADYHVARMLAVKATLEWLRDQNIIIGGTGK
jgi:hypothetical protein